MSDQITTKPGDKYRSIKRPRVYRALRRQGYSKGAAARISNAQAQRTKAYTLAEFSAIALKETADPAFVALAALCTPDLLTLKAQQLAPGVSRIRGDLCNVHGRWGSCRAAGYGGAAPTSKRVPTKKLPAAPGGKKGRRAAASRKPVKTEEQKRQEHEAKRAQAQQERDAKQEENRKKVLTDLGIDEGAQQALADLRAGKQPDEEAIKRAGLEDAGLIEHAADGTWRMTPSGRALEAAAATGDAGRARDTVSGARDRLGARRGREAAAQERKRAAEERHGEAERKRAERLAKQGKGGGKGKKAPVSTTPPAPLPRSSASPRVVRGGGISTRRPPAPKPKKEEPPPKPELPKALIDATQALSEGRELDEATEALLIRNGLARRNRDGALVLTAAGLRTTKKEAAQQLPSFAVFKDSTGAYRWISRTTTAFEDRDDEVISTKALENDCIRADADHLYGPLRWWHVGRPDPLSLEAPWGAGIDLGWCDFNAVSGRTLIESGTFKTEAIALAVAAKADALELSPGFFHAIGEPDASGVFHHIRRFERSLVPKWAGRASNPYTGLVVEKTMDQRKIEALKVLGVDEATVKSLIADVERTEKEADSSGVRYKEEKKGLFDFFSALLRGEQVTEKEEVTEESTSPQAVAVEARALTEQFAAMKAQIDGLVAEIATLKTDPAAPIEEKAEGDMQMGDEAGIEDDSLAVDEGGLTLSSEDIAAIGQMVGTVLTSALEPLIGAMGITQKLEGHMGELKSLMGGYVKQKEEGDAQRADQVAALKATIDQQQAMLEDSRAKLTELLGDQPSGGYRPTQATDNTAAAVFAAVKGGPPEGGYDPNNQFADLIQNLFPGLAPSQ